MRIALGLPAGISDGPGAACWDLPTPWVWKQKQLALSLFLFPAFSKMHQGTKGPKGTKKKEAGPLKKKPEMPLGGLEIQPDKCRLIRPGSFCFWLLGGCGGISA
jgi:hypothetical protein